MISAASGDSVSEYINIATGGLLGQEFLTPLIWAGTCIYISYNVSCNVMPLNCLSLALYSSVFKFVCSQNLKITFDPVVCVWGTIFFHF